MNNFAKSRTYPGRKLLIDLESRVPINNPFRSGEEKEYFLVGSVVADDCTSITYLGRVSSIGDESLELDVATL